MLLKSNFKHIDEIVKTYLLKEENADAILFDLGFSSLQLDDEEGFPLTKKALSICEWIRCGSNCLRSY